jgi:hypothetical protein
MPAYGKIKVDTITYDLSGTATDVPVSTIAVDSDLALKADLSGATFTGQINGTSLVLNNDLTVNGTLTYLNSTDLEITDKNIIIGKVSTPSDATADLGGITLKGATDKEIKWVNATDAWTFSEHIHLGDNKKLLVGDGSDLELWHSGSHSYVSDVGTGDLVITSNGTGIQLAKHDPWELMLKAIPDGSVELYEAGTKRFETSATGCTVTGTLAATAVTGDGSGLTGIDTGGEVVCKHVYHSSVDNTWNLTVPSGVTTMRVYAVGHGGNGSQPSGGGYHCTSGAGGGMAYGDITVVAGQTISFAVTNKVATCSYGGTTMLTANPGANGVANATTNAAGGTATKHSSVANGGAYSGGLGGYMNSTYGPGGGGAGSPLGNGCKAAKGGAGGIGCSGTWTSYSGGGAGSGNTGGGTDYVSGGSAPNQKARDGVIYPQFTDPLIKWCLNAGQVSHWQGINLHYSYESYADTGVGGMYDNKGSGARNHQNGGAFGGGGGGSQVSGGSDVYGGHGGLLCGGGGTGGSTGSYTSGNGGYGGGGGGTRNSSHNANAGAGGHAAIFVFYK